MKCEIALIGFGEAASTFARSAQWRARASAWDIDPSRLAITADLGLAEAQGPGEALDGAALVLSLVTADQALSAARDYAPLLTSGALWCDMNSIAPDTKRAAALAVETAGGRYVDVAVMSPVNPAGLGTPLLASGPQAGEAAKSLSMAGFSNVRVVGDVVGRAAMIKMLRSVMYKGMEALTAECLVACERAGVTEEVLSSFGNDWSAGADYRLDRMLVHGLRRAAEMAESASTLQSLGVPARLTEGTVGWQRAMGELRLGSPPEGLRAKLAAIAEKLP